MPPLLAPTASPQSWFYEPRSCLSPVKHHGDLQQMLPCQASPHPPRPLPLRPRPPSPGGSPFPDLPNPLRSPLIPPDRITACPSPARAPLLAHGSPAGRGSPNQELRPASPGSHRGLAGCGTACERGPGTGPMSCVRAGPWTHRRAGSCTGRGGTRPTGNPTALRGSQQGSRLRLRPARQHQAEVWVKGLPSLGNISNGSKPEDRGLERQKDVGKLHPLLWTELLLLP